MGFLSSLFGGDQADAAKKAAKKQSAAEAANKALAQKYTKTNLGDLDKALAGALTQYDTGQAGATNALQPYAQAGGNALTTLLGALGLGGAGSRENALAAFQTGPGYGFAMDQGVSALDRSAAARGNLYSGAQGKALTTFGQGLANQEWGNWLDRISGVASSGQNAATNIGNVLAQFAGSRADALLGTAANKVGARTNGLAAINTANSNRAAAQASGIVGAANARGNALSQLLNLGGMLGGAFLGRPMKAA